MKLFVLRWNGITLKMMTGIRPGINSTCQENFNHTLNFPHQNLKPKTRHSISSDGSSYYENNEDIAQQAYNQDKI